MEKVYEYHYIRNHLKVGDMLGFGGNGVFSNTIKFITDSDLSHVGGVFNTALSGRDLVMLMESTSLGKGEAGVKLNQLSSHIKYYDGDIWVYPLKADVFFNSFNAVEYTKFLLDMKGRKYDMPQAIGSALDYIPDNKEDFDKLFCSELMYEAYEKAGAVPADNASEKTPADIAALDIFEQRFKIK